jgi:hypothetical protein
MVGCCECSDEPLGSYATELVRVPEGLNVEKLLL